MRPKLRVGGKVINPVATDHGPLHCRAIAHVGESDIDPIEGQVIDRRARSFQDPHALAVYKPVGVL